MAKTCPECNAELPAQNRYCGLCGSNVVPVTLHDLAQRLATLEAHLNKHSQSLASEQRVVELETSQRILDDLQKRARRFLFFAGIPFTLLLLWLAFVGVRSVDSLAHLAASSRGAVQPVLDKARSEAKNASTMAVQALRTSREVNDTIASTHASVSRLKHVVEETTMQAGQLETAVKQSQSEVSVLQSRVVQQSNQVQQLEQRNEAVRVDENTSAVSALYPGVFGTDVVEARNGFVLEMKRKKPQDTYLVLALAAPGSRSPLSAQIIARLKSSLEDEGIKVFLGGVGLYAIAGPTSQERYDMGDDSCALAKMRPPCVLYFRKELPERLRKLQPIVSTAQAIPRESFSYVSPDSLSSLARELLAKSGLDGVVVLGSP
jgi:hypothetical protein